MPDTQRIDPVLVEKAAKARHEKGQLGTPWEQMDRRYREAKLDVLRECAQAVFDELGLGDAQ